MNLRETNRKTIKQNMLNALIVTLLLITGVEAKTNWTFSTKKEIRDELVPIIQYKLTEDRDYIIEFTPKGNSNYLCMYHHRGLTCIPKEINDIPIPHK